MSGGRHHTERDQERPGETELAVREPRGGVGGEVNLSPGVIFCYIIKYKYKLYSWSDLNALTTRVGGLVLVALLVLVLVLNFSSSSSY